MVLGAGAGIRCRCRCRCRGKTARNALNGGQKLDSKMFFGKIQNGSTAI
jgi:hypothetical protein